MYTFFPQSAPQTCRTQMCTGHVYRTQINSNYLFYKVNTTSKTCIQLLISVLGMMDFEEKGCSDFLLTTDLFPMIVFNFLVGIMTVVLGEFVSFSQETTIQTRKHVPGVIKYSVYIYI